MYLQQGPPTAENKPKTHRTHRTRCCTIRTARTLSLTPRIGLLLRVLCPQTSSALGHLPSGKLLESSLGCAPPVETVRIPTLSAVLTILRLPLCLSQTAKAGRRRAWHPFSFCFMRRTRKSAPRWIKAQEKGASHSMGLTKGARQPDGCGPWAPS
jgi:hypothetical protein